MRTANGKPAFRGQYSKCFCGKPSEEHPDYPEDPIFKILCTGGIVLLNELAMMNRSMEILNADISDVEFYKMLEDLEARGVSKARLKSRFHKTMERIDRVHAEKPQPKPRRKTAPARKTTRARSK